jgi:hypothetical protein
MVEKHLPDDNHNNTSTLPSLTARGADGWHKGDVMVLELPPQHHHVRVVRVHRDRVRGDDDSGHEPRAGEGEAIVQPSLVPTWGANSNEMSNKVNGKG